MNALQSELVKAIDGDGGGEYTLVDELVFAVGAAVRFFTDLVIEGVLRLADGGALVAEDGSECTFESGALCTMSAGSTLSLEGTCSLSGTLSVTGTGTLTITSTGEQVVTTFGQLNVRNAGELNVESSGQCTIAGKMELTGTGSDSPELSGTLDVMGVNARINLVGGAKIIGSVGTEIQVFDHENLKINNAPFSFRLMLTPQYAGPAWISRDDGTWLMGTTGTSNYIMFPLPLKPGDRLTQLRMVIEGGFGSGHAGGEPDDSPQMQLLWVDTNGVAHVEQTVLDSNQGSAYDAVHTVMMTGGVLAGSGYLMTSHPHYVRILSEGIDGGVDNSTRLIAISGDARALGFRGPTEIY